MHAAPCIRPQQHLQRGIGEGTRDVRDTDQAVGRRFEACSRRSKVLAQAVGGFHGSRTKVSELLSDDPGTQPKALALHTQPDRPFVTQHRAGSEGGEGGDVCGEVGGELLADGPRLSGSLVWPPL